ncbi:flavin reductase family protein [Frigidibacter oleivorans]|uniref:flavin reductase family protein n=1 Tax=Frigidibacter oleivorans TaxID=2487129 RepID=UPI000F8E6529|nr:flavin reductase family protein [Frigidibacter oleivorans]
MFYDPRSESHGLPHNPWLALIVPRPIGWISTRSGSGVANLAPYSCFNAISGNPPFVMFSSDSAKDSLGNAEATGEFCVNIATFELREAMNATSAPYPPEIDEFAAAGLTPAPCRNIGAPRVAESPVSVECRLSQVIDLVPATGAPCTNRMAIGEVVGIHIDERVLRDGLVDVELLRPLGRMGYREYTVPPRSFEMPRPVLG